MNTSRRHTALQSDRRLAANQGTTKQAKRLAAALRHRAPAVPVPMLRAIFGRSLDLPDVHGDAGLPFKSALVAKYALFAGLAELALPTESHNPIGFVL